VGSGLLGAAICAGAPFVLARFTDFDAPTQALAAAFLWELLPFMVLTSAGAVLRVANEVHGRFTVVALTPLLRAAVVIGALLALTGLMLVKHNEAAANRAQDREFLEAASEGIVALLSIDHGRAEADVQRILDLSIGAFRDDFASRAGDFITTAQKGKAVTKGAVTAAALESAGDDNAVVLVAATSQVTNVSGARDDPRPWRMSVTVSRDEDQWKMSNVEFVP
jgi:Mce-associated membrane protein